MANRKGMIREEANPCNTRSNYTEVWEEVGTAVTHTSYGFELKRALDAVLLQQSLHNYAL